MYIYTHTDTHIVMGLNYEMLVHDGGEEKERRRKDAIEDMDDDEKGGQINLLLIFNFFK